VARIISRHSTNTREVIILNKRNRNVSLSFYVSEKEHIDIKKRIEENGFENMRAYLLKMALNGRIIHVEMDSINEMVRLLANATNNINQIARRVNETRNIYAADISDIQEQQKIIWNQTNEILRRLSAIE